MKKLLKIIAAAAVVLAAAALTAALLAKLVGKKEAPIGGELVSRILEEAEFPNESAETAVRSAASIIGRVHYFWGGKSFCVGEDPEWGRNKVVESSGSPTTGSVRPYGLDCSGLVTWAYIQAGWTIDEIGNGTWNQWFASEEINKDELRPGDLGFQNVYPGSSGNHVGIFIGFYKGKPLFIHCSPGYDNVVVTSGEGIFEYFRRPQRAGAEG